MATILDDDQNKQQQGQTQGSEQVVGNGGSAGTIDAQGSGGGASTPPAQAGGGGFTNLQSYVTANQGNDAAMGQQVQGLVANDAKTATDQTGAYQSGAQSQIASSTVNQDQDVQSRIKDNASSINKDAFDKQYNASWSGPTTADQYQGYGDAQKATDKVTSEAKSAGGDNTARQGLLSQVYARPDYGQGEQTLDSFILGSGQGGQQALQNINQQYGNFGQNFTDAAGAVQSAIDQGKKTTQATHDATHQAVDQAQGAYNDEFSNLQNLVGSQAQTMTRQYQGAVGSIGSQDPATRAAGFKAAGIDPQVGEFMRSEGYDPSQIISAGKAQSLGDAANGTDVSNYQALQGLLGGTSKFDFSKAAGGTNAFNVDQGKLGSASQAQQILSQAQASLAQQNAQRAADFNNFKSGLARPTYTGEAAALGISPADYAYATAHGINPADMVSQGAQMNLGNVLNGDKATQFTNLLKALGVTPKEDLTPAANVGSSYNFDSGAFNSKVAAARAAEAPQAPQDIIAGPATPSGDPLSNAIGRGDTWISKRIGLGG